MLTIIASMERELAGLRRESLIFQGAGEHRQFELKVVGVGEAQAGQSVTSLAGQHRILADTLYKSEDGILLLGFAGGVDPSLAPGVLVISPRYHQDAGQYAGGNSLEPDPAMWRQAVDAASDAGLPFDQGESLTVARPVSTVADKGALFRRYQVGTVNMEDYPVAVAARNAGVPFLAVRAVLDPAGQSLPPYVLPMSKSPVKAVLGTAVRPWRIAHMLHLASQMRLAQFALTSFAQAYLRRSLDRSHQEDGAPRSDASTWPTGR